MSRVGETVVRPCLACDGAGKHYGNGRTCVICDGNRTVRRTLKELGLAEVSPSRP